MALLAATPFSPVDVVLKDGSTVRLRTAEPDDLPALRAFYAGLSRESLYFRFFHATGADPEDAARLVRVDPRQERVLLAQLGERVVAVGRYVRTAAAKAEAAFLVADALQGRGIGTRLLDELATLARADGIEMFTASVLGDNRRMLDVFLDSGFEIQRKGASGVVDVDLSLGETPRHELKLHERAARAARASLGAFFTPSTVAVIGAGRTRGTIGAEVLNNLRATGYPGRIVPINPHAADVQGLPAYARVSDVPGPIDLALITVPAAQVEAVLDDCVAKGVKAVVLITAGFSETGPAGRVHEARLLAKVRAAGIRMIGPNCMGLLNADPAVRLNATFSPVFPPPGRVAFSTQSGALGLAILEYASRVNLGLSTFASIGNKADVSSNDLLQYWADDPNTDVILLYLESFGNPRKFAELAREVGARKPIIAVKAGRSRAGARAAASHTGALAASDAIVERALPPGRRDPHRHHRRDVRRGDAARAPADPGRAARGHPHQRRRARHSRRRRVRGAGPAAHARSPTTPCASCGRSCPRPPASTTRSTCWRRRVRPTTSAPCARCSPIPASTAC